MQELLTRRWKRAAATATAAAVASAGVIALSDGLGGSAASADPVTKTYNYSCVGIAFVGTLKMAITVKTGDIPTTLAVGAKSPAFSIDTTTVISDPAALSAISLAGVATLKSLGDPAIGSTTAGATATTIINGGGQNNLTLNLGAPIPDAAVDPSGPISLSSTTFFAPRLTFSQPGPVTIALSSLTLHLKAFDSDGVDLSLPENGGVVLDNKVCTLDGSDGSLATINVIPGGTPTPTPVVSPSTPTPTPVVSPSTPTPTPTPVVSPSTPTPTPTPVVSPSTPTPTPTPVVSPSTPTPTPTPVVSPSTPTPTPTPVVSPSTPTPTPTPVVSPSTPTPTPTPVVSPSTPTPTPTPVVSPSTPTPTPTPVVSPSTPTPTPVATPSTPTPTPGHGQHLDVKFIGIAGGGGLALPFNGSAALDISTSGAITGTATVPAVTYYYNLFGWLPVVGKLGITTGPVTGAVTGGKIGLSVPVSLSIDSAKLLGVFPLVGKGCKSAPSTLALTQKSGLNLSGALKFPAFTGCGQLGQIVNLLTGVPVKVDISAKLK